MFFPFLPYLSQILTELLKLFISLQRIKISIYVCNVCEVIFKLFGMVNFTIKDRFFFCCGLIRTGPKQSGYGPLISGSVYTGCGCQLPRFEAKNRTGLDFKTLIEGGGCLSREGGDCSLRKGSHSSMGSKNQARTIKIA
jgi:hypothetical protein